MVASARRVARACHRIRQPAATADGTDLLVRDWAATIERGAGPWAIGPAGPRPRRTLRPLRARRRPAGGGRPRRPGLRPPRQGRVGRAAGPRRPWEQFHDDLAERLAASGTAGGRRSSSTAIRWAGLIVLGYLLTDRPETGPRRPLVAGPRFTLPVEEALADLSRIVPTLAVPNGIDGDPVARPDGGRQGRGRPVKHGKYKSERGPFHMR